LPIFFYWYILSNKLATKFICNSIPAVGIIGWEILSTDFQGKMFVANKYNIKTYSGLKKELGNLLQIFQHLFFFFFLINMNVRINLYIPQLIPWILKLTTSNICFFIDKFDGNKLTLFHFKKNYIIQYLDLQDKWTIEEIYYKIVKDYKKSHYSYSKISNNPISLSLDLSF
jgi:hypothetical protein